MKLRSATEPQTAVTLRLVGSEVFASCTSRSIDQNIFTKVIKREGQGQEGKGEGDEGEEGRSGTKGEGRGGEERKKLYIQTPDQPPLAAPY